METQIDDFLFGMKRGIPTSDKAYSIDWNKLMAVVERICAMKFEDGEYCYLRTFGIINENGNYMVRFNRHSIFEHKELREALFLAVMHIIRENKINP